MRLRRGPVPTLTIFEANSTPIVCEERMRPKGVSGQVGEGERERITFVFYEAVQDAGSVGFVRLRSLSGGVVVEEGSVLSAAAWSEKYDFG